ncbi:DUF6509 family protein [Cytobacillus sp. FJAT-54145]|uniref:DUF6509 family protein n=1 Tax=Cytobacillus spartinae TaxID=3299023 RepID=A0ABW6KHG0_9BACI
MEFTEYTVEKIEDPFGILIGDRYEYYIHIEVPEDDELYSEKGLKLKVLFIVDDKGSRISHYHIIEETTEKVLDFELEEDELQKVENFCKEHFTEEIED